MVRPARLQLVVLLGALLGAALALTGCAATPSVAPAPSAPLAQQSRSADLPTVALADLPPQARTTVARIDRGGPFPYRQDGTTFQNREALLPRQPSGYYREYTVVTPGEDDRGPRRIVAGQDGDLYYTEDHYGSFREVLR